MGIAKTSKQKEAAWEFLKYVDDKSRLAVLEDRMPGVLPDMLPWIKSNFAEWPDLAGGDAGGGDEGGEAPGTLATTPSGRRWPRK